MGNYSLIELMKNDFNFESLKEAKNQTKKSKETLISSAEQYNSKYQTEIEQGTKKRQLMLESAGLQNASPIEQEEFFKDNNEFMPTVQTPILNFLYFLTRDYRDVVDDVSVLKEEYDAKYGHLVHDYELGNNSGQKQNVPHMEDYIYQNMDSKTFQKLKKLKAKSKSDNENEAFQAYRMCMKICKENNLDFDKIPDLYS